MGENSRPSQGPDGDPPDRRAAGRDGAASPKRRGGLWRALHKLTSSDDDLHAEQLQAEVEGAGAQPVSSCRDRAIVCVAGTLRTVTLQPRAGVPALQAELWDGSGTLDLVWLGRRRIAGIEPGATIRVEGRLAEHEGHRVIFNPRYELRSVAT